jgi:DNA-binding NarL/FixJ family response regulator
MNVTAQGKLFLFEWNEAAAVNRARELAAAGWQVETEFEEGSRGCHNCRAFAPDVVTFDLAVKPSHSREAGRALRQAKTTRGLPFVFVDGTEEDVAKAREKVPDAMFTTSNDLKKTLGRLPKRKVVD